VNEAKILCFLPFLLLRLIVVGTLLLGSQVASAFSFVPTMDEWITWPGYCRAKYATLDLVGTTQFANRVPATEIAHWKEVLGEKAFLHVHHYCAAIAFYSHGLVEEDPQRRRFQFSESADNAFYTFQRIGVNDPIAPTVGALLARARVELGQVNEARQVLQELISAQPSADAPYLVLSLIARRGGHNVDALRILEDGNSATHGNSAEINYALGLLYFDNKRYDDARECAVKAYSLGYPLPGLKRKLALAGYQI
jgi:tetratricopeptide (TPR) repeat protein